MIWFAVFFFVIISLFSLFFIFVANPIIADYSLVYVNSITEQAVNSAIIKILNDPQLYPKIINIEKNAAGEITYIEADYLKINQLLRQIVASCQKNVQQLSIKGLALPLGTFSGISFLTGKGPGIKFKVVPIGAVSSDIYSQFLSAGVNNTLHKIYAEIDVSVGVVLPIKQKNISAKNKILICENVIIGKVPQVYFNSQTLNDKLHLVP